MKYLLSFLLVVAILALVGCSSKTPTRPRGTGTLDKINGGFDRTALSPSIEGDFDPNDSVFVDFNYQHYYLGRYEDVDTFTIHTKVVVGTGYPIKMLIGNVPVFEGVEILKTRLHHIVPSYDSLSTPPNTATYLWFTPIIKDGNKPGVFQGDDNLDLIQDVYFYYNGRSSNPDLPDVPVSEEDTIWIQMANGNIRMYWNASKKVWERNLRLPADTTCHHWIMPVDRGGMMRIVGLHAQMNGEEIEFWFLVHVEGIWHVFQYKWVKYGVWVIENCGPDNRVIETAENDPLYFFKLRR